MDLRWIPLELLPRLEEMISDEITCGQRVRTRDALAIALGLHGMRIGEICRAARSDLYVSGHVLHVPKFKRGNARDLQLHPSLVEGILQWRGSTSCEPLLFTATGARMFPTHLRRKWKVLSDRLMREHVKFHGLRHTFAIRLYSESGKDLLLVQQKLGHKSVKSTEVYARSLAKIPDSCLIRLNQTHIEINPVSQRLRIFCPAG